jgi:hypothetical protein
MMARRIHWFVNHYAMFSSDSFKHLEILYALLNENGSKC